MTREELLVLKTLEDDLFFSFAAIQSRLEHPLDRKQIRRACRSLARKGLTKFASGLWTECGEPGGSGYGITKEGRAVLTHDDTGEKR